MAHTPISNTITRPSPEIRFRMGVFDTPVPTNWYDGSTSANGNVSVLGICDLAAATLTFGTGQISTALGNESVSARWSMGYAHTSLGVGTLDAGIGTVSEGNVATTYAHVDDRLYGQSQLVLLDDSHPIFPVVGFAGIIDVASFPDPPDIRTFIQILGDNTETNRYRGFVITVTGYDAQHCENRPDLGTGTDPLTMDCTGLLAGSDPGTWYHTTDGVPHLTICISSSIALFSAAVHNVQIGVAHRDGTQYSLCQTESNGIGNGRPVASFRNDCICHSLDPTSGLLNYQVTVSNWTATSFDITPSANAGGDILHLLTFGFDTETRSKIITFDTPTVIGNVSYTGAGFTPQFALFIASSLEAFNTVKFSDPLAGGVQISAVSSVSGNITQQANSIRIKNGANPTDTASRSVSKALSIPSDSASGVVEATLISMDADGFTLNYTAVAAAAKKVVVMLVEETEIACNINGTIYFEKQDTEGNLLAGAEFVLHSDTLGNFTIVDNIESDFFTTGYDFDPVDGQFLLTEVPPGNYTLTETVQPFHYVLDDTPLPFTVGPLEAVELTFINEPIPSTILIEKRDENGNLIPGATFLVEKEGGGNVTVLDGGVDDLDPMPGRTVVGNLTPGNYTVTETIPPDGFTLDSVPRSVTVGADDNASVGLAGEVDDDDFVDTVNIIIGGSGVQPEITACLFQPQTFNMELMGLNSFIELGPFRYAEQKQADETSMISTLILALTDADVGVVEEENWNELDGEENWNTLVDVLGEDVNENWGENDGDSDDFTLKLYTQNDGMNPQFQGPEILEPIEDFGSAKTYSPAGFSGIYHRLRLEANEIDESFQVKVVDIAGQLTGTQS